MIVPEKSDHVRKIIIPHYLFKGGIAAFLFLSLLAIVLFFDYANVMQQINENKQLKAENRQLKQSVQSFKNKMITIENTLDRVKTFSTKLKIITNIEDLPSAPIPTSLPPLKEIPTLPNSAPSSEPSSNKKEPVRESNLEIQEDAGESEAIKTAYEPSDKDYDPSKVPSVKEDPNAKAHEEWKVRRLYLLAALNNDEIEGITLTDSGAENLIQGEFKRLDDAYSEVNQFALIVEQEMQNIFEKLNEKRAWLAGLPTRIPTLGYISSEFGVRISPYDGKRKMHEGIDIANRYGADIVSTADGVVVFSGVKPGYGKIVIIDHKNGFETKYAHNSKVYVNAGDRVKRGQRIAAVGNTGHSTGPHCHYEVQVNGTSIDPCPYILDQAGSCSKR